MKPPKFSIWFYIALFSVSVAVFGWGNRMEAESREQGLKECSSQVKKL